MLKQCLHYVESKTSNDSTKQAADVEFSFGRNKHQWSSLTKQNLGLVIDGKTLAFALDVTQADTFISLARQCRSVLCCRSTPLQKSMVVKLVRDKLKAMTLSVGKLFAFLYFSFFFFYTTLLDVAWPSVFYKQ